MNDQVKRLREIGEIAIGAIQEPCGLVWHPANELLPAADRIECLEHENAALGLKLDTARMAVDELQRGKILAAGMANMIRGFILKTVERETLDEMAAKYRKWEEDYCHRGGA